MDRVVPLVISPFAFFFLHFSKAEKEPQTVILVSMDGMPWNLISGEFANTPKPRQSREKWGDSEVHRDSCPEQNMVDARIIPHWFVS